MDFSLCSDLPLLQKTSKQKSISPDIIYEQGSQVSGCDYSSTRLIILPCSWFLHSQYKEKDTVPQKKVTV